MDFAALHVRSGYSFLQSGITLSRAFSVAKKLGYKGFGLADVDSLIGFPELDKLSKVNQIPSLFGCDLTYNEDTLSLYVLNEEGYKNILCLSFEASKNPISAEFLRNHSDGLALILDISKSKLFSLDSQEAQKEYLAQYERLFEVFYLGLPFGEKQKVLNDRARKLVTKFPYPLIAFPHMLYEKKEDQIVLEIAYAIKENASLGSRKSVGDNYFPTLEEIETFYTPDEIKETMVLVSKPNFNFKVKRGKLLKFEVKENETSDSLLREKAFEGLKNKLNGEIPSNYQERLTYELEVISKMGYSDYFLIVQDYVNFARNSGIYVGPGRGSAGGSLVSYALDIVKLDPLKYDLLFERFLNPERQSLPDIDIDFAHYRRDEVASYLIRKYGENRAAHIITMQTLGAKGAIRDIGRVFDIGDRDIDLLCKSIQDADLSLRENYKLGGRFKDLVDNEPQYLEIVALASKIEGLPRQSSFHPAGIVLNNEDITESIPLKIDPQVGLVVQYEHDYLEDQGFLKMDILSLRNLSIIEKCINEIKVKKGIDVDYQTIPYDDPKAIKEIHDLNVMGLFQLESGGMKNAARKLGPTCFEDVIALISLFRPGPMEEIQTYADRKYGRKQITYPIPELEEILKPTYGVIVYQEQIMRIAQKMAGFSLGEADLLRKAISKKDAKKLDALKLKFVNGCITKGHSKTVGENVYALVYKFASYGFNKSHAVSYGTITCQMAYLKAYYPEEFYAAILDFSSAVGDSTFNKIMTETRKLNYKLAVPSVNDSKLGFVITENKIIMPLFAIKGISFEFAKDLYIERINNGPYKDFYDFVLRAKQSKLSHIQLVALVDGGALDCLNKNRCSLRVSAAEAVNYAEMFYGENGDRIQLPFDIPKPLLREVVESDEENMAAEKEAINMMITHSPLSKYRAQYPHAKTIADLEECGGFAEILAVIADKNTRATKNGGSITFLTMYDEESTKEFLVFKRVFDTYFPLLKKDKCVLATVKKDNFKEDSYIVENLKDLAKGE